MRVDRKRARPREVSKIGHSRVGQIRSPLQAPHPVWKPNSARKQGFDAAKSALAWPAMHWIKRHDVSYAEIHFS
jgi:hypothetical protein